MGREVRHVKHMQVTSTETCLLLYIWKSTPPSQAQQSLYIPKISLYCDLCNNECVFLNEKAFSKHCWTAHGVRVTLKDWRRHYALKDNKAELKRWLLAQPCLTLQQYTKPERRLVMQEDTPIGCALIRHWNKKDLQRVCTFMMTIDYDECKGDWFTMVNFQ